jgi:alpha-tubulin suppressor-like RCC1 family protein
VPRCEVSPLVKAVTYGVNGVSPAAVPGMFGNALTGAGGITTRGESVNRTSSTARIWCQPTIWAMVSLSALALPLASQAAAAARPRPAQGAAGTVRHWGTFFGGANPLKPEDMTTSPAPVTLPRRVAQVATSNSTEYALLTDGSVYAWGLGGAGQLGDGATANSFTTPVRVRFPAGVKIAFLPIDVMPFDTGLAVDTSGHVWGWGDNQGGELCLGNHTMRRTPVKLPFTRVSAVAGAFDHALYEARGRVWACGLNKLGELGDGTTRSSSRPVRVKGLGRSAHVVFLVSAFANSGALLAGGKYLDWGTNGEGQLGIGSTRKRSDVPVTVPLPARVQQVSQGGSAPGNGQTLALLTNGRLYAWGADGQGQLGDGKTTMESSPELITPPAGVTYQALAASGSTSYGVSTTGAVYAWGGGKEGQIGDGATESRLTPVKVASGATGISATADDVVIK